MEELITQRDAILERIRTENPMSSKIKELVKELQTILNKIRDEK